MAADQGLGATAARAVALEVGGAVAGLVATKFFDSVLGTLGLGDEATDFAAYFGKVEDGLSKIEGGLDALRGEVASMMTQLNKLGGAINKVSDEVRLVSYQAGITSLNTYLAVINDKFDHYLAAVGDLGDPVRRQGAATRLFALFDSNDLDLVSTNLTNIHDIVLGANGSKALLDEVVEAARQGLDAFAAAGPFDTAKEALVFGDLVTGSEELPSWIDGSLVLSRGTSAMAAILDASALPMFKAILGVGAKALLILTSGWEGSSMETIALPRHAAELDAMRVAIGAFHTSTLNIDALFAELLKKYRQGINKDGFSNDWAMWSTDVSRFADDHDPMWEAYHPGVPNPYHIVVLTRNITERPWDYGSCRCTFSNNVRWFGQEFSQIDIPKPSALAFVSSGYLELVAALAPQGLR